MRKLADSHKALRRYVGQPVDVERYPKVESRRFIDHLNCHQLDKNYDLGRGVPDQLRPRQI